MIHHYLQPGVSPENIINRTGLEKLFFKASMTLHFEEEAEKYRQLFGGGHNG